MDLLLIGLLFVGGLLAGFYGSSVGGGTLVTFPLLVLAGLPTYVAIATNRFAAVFGEFFSAARFYKEKKLDLRLGLILGLAAAIGSFIGASIVLAVDANILNVVIAVIFLLLAVFLFNQEKFGVKEKKSGKKSLILPLIVSFVLGIYGGFFGAGFGTFIVIAMAFTGFSFVRSAAIGRVVGFVMSITAAIVFAFNGVINYDLGLAAGIGSAVGAWIGAGYAVKKGNNYIKALLILIVILTVIKLLSAVLI